MALSDFLGETAEIKIIDFLAENRDQRYNLTELAGCTGLSRTTVHEKLPKLIYNKTVKIAETVGRSKLFQIEDNEIIDGLMKAVFSNSFLIASEGLEEEEAYEQIRGEIRAPLEEQVRYSKISKQHVEFNTSGELISTVLRPTVSGLPEATGKEPYFGTSPMGVTSGTASVEDIGINESQRIKKPEVARV